MLTGLTKTADRRQTGAHEIADRLMSRIRNPNGGQFAGPMQLGQVDRVATIGLDPISRVARDQRRSDDDAIVPGKRQLTLNSIAATSGLVTELELPPLAHQLRRQSFQGRRRVRDRAVFPDILVPIRLGERDCDRIVVNVKATYVIDLFTRLLCMRLCVGPRRNPR